MADSKPDSKTDPSQKDERDSGDKITASKELVKAGYGGEAGCGGEVDQDAVLVEQICRATSKMVVARIGETDFKRLICNFETTCRDAQDNMEQLWFRYFFMVLAEWKQVAKETFQTRFRSSLEDWLTCAFVKDKDKACCHAALKEVLPRVLDWIRYSGEGNLVVRVSGFHYSSPVCILAHQSLPKATLLTAEEAQQFHDGWPNDGVLRAVAANDVELNDWNEYKDGSDASEIVSFTLTYDDS